MIARIIIILVLIGFYSCRPEEPITIDELVEVPKGDLLFSGSATVPRLIGRDSLLIYAKTISQIPYSEHERWFIFDYKNELRHDLYFIPPSTKEIDIRNGNTIYASGYKSLLITSGKDTIVFSEIRNPSFNNEGNAFVYCSRSSIYTYTIENRSVNFVYQTDSSTYPSYPCWIGDKIYFEADSAGTASHIYKISSSGGEPTKLTFGYVKDTHPRAWGEYVAFSRLLVYPYQILVNKDNTTIYSYSGYAFYPEISSDTLFYSSITAHGSGMNVYVTKWR